ncbi:MAG: glutamine--fructose-6-phosphate transaminase (isomerizing) [Nitrospirae bacterium]|nr:glutamine--fructose-6-phosphate transaminase (isomerizing) [Nitrospirota bacterium]MBI3351838.1 glutamine--fructose-6-phosphate transaminase (isomerizing) [Nitrospirota bacterium]
MCGIIGYVGQQEAVPVLMEGLKRLEYRGYDSAGVAFIHHGRLVLNRSVGKLANLEALLSKKDTASRIGIGHTRWATHGRPSEVNAHPHRVGHTVLVHNGIIENFLQLKKELTQKGSVIKSETDTEIVAHLIDRETRGGKSLENAVQSVLKEIKGAYALVILSEEYPDQLIAVRNGCPLVIGMGRGEYFVASDIPATLSHTRNYIFLDDGEMAVLTSKGVEIKDFEGHRKVKNPVTVDWSPVMAEKGGYKHFMLKEIFEQPQAIADTLRGRISLAEPAVNFHEIGLSEPFLKNISKIHMVACGTSWHAALVGKFLIEQLARVPVEVDIASEFRYRDPILSPSDLLIAISQSGETADTLAGMMEAKNKKMKTLAVCNVVGSTMAREADGVIYTYAGPEIGVASTKAFTTQLTVLFLFALSLGQLRARLTPDQVSDYLRGLVNLPRIIDEVLARENETIEISKTFFKSRDFLFLGRGINYPIALEGALKLKEISYIHAEGYPAGEMKHGPIALIDEHLPVVVLIPKDSVYSKVFNSIMEIKARNGIVIAITNAQDDELLEKVDYLLRVPETDPLFNPIVMSIPLQLLAYHIAVLCGSDVDQPRNLAKSVTVE